MQVSGKNLVVRVLDAEARRIGHADEAALHERLRQSAADDGVIDQSMPQKTAV